MTNFTAELKVFQILNRKMTPESFQGSCLLLIGFSLAPDFSALLCAGAQVKYEHFGGTQRNIEKAGATDWMQIRKEGRSVLCQARVWKQL